MGLKFSRVDRMSKMEMLLKSLLELEIIKWRDCNLRQRVKVFIYTYTVSSPMSQTVSAKNA